MGAVRQAEASASALTHQLAYTRPKLYPKQLAAIFDPRRYSIIEASTKAGKTAGCIIWLGEQAFAGRSGWNYWWVAPGPDQTRMAYDRMLRSIPDDLRVGYLQPLRIVLVTGATIWFKSADKPDSLYGEDVYAAVFDECSRAKEAAWFALRSTLTATRGPVRLIGNVKGRKNWFFNLARRAQKGDGQDGSEMGWHKITAYDAVAGGVLDKAEVEDAKRVLPEAAFRETYMAEAVDDGSNPFGIEAIKRCIEPIAKTRPRAFGIDVARKMDWFVAIGIDDYGRTCAFDRFQHVPWEAAYPRVHNLVGSTPALVDDTGGGDPVLGRFQTMPGGRYEGYTFSSRSKQMLMEGLAIAISAREVTFPEGPIVDELEIFEFEYTKTGVRYSAPAGSHDDCVMALALAVHHKTTSRPAVVFTEEVLQRFSRPGSSARGRLIR